LTVEGAGQPPIAGRRLATLTLLLGGFAAFGPLSMDLYLPAFPHLAEDLDTTAAAVQLTLTADVAGLVVGQLIAGPLSDAWGARRVHVRVRDRGHPGAHPWSR
jgi:MFS transporter, DHA1 family, multidrug resistance protein